MGKNILKWTVSGFGLGFVPKAPGTFGTLLGIPLCYALNFLNPLAYMAATLVFIMASIFLCEAYERIQDEHDASHIVIDEVAGFLVAMVWLPVTWKSFVLGFILFRILDAVKPFPISLVDQKIKGGLGVVADDLVAGVIANMILQVIYTNTIWLF